MNQLILIIALICITISANSQDLSITLTEGPVVELNTIFGEGVKDFQDPQDNIQVKDGYGYFATDTVQVSFKRRKLERMSAFILVVEDFDITDNQVNFKFDSDYKGVLFPDEDKWRFFLINDDMTFYFAGEVLKVVTIQ